MKPNSERTRTPSLITAKGETYLPIDFTSVIFRLYCRPREGGRERDEALSRL